MKRLIHTIALLLVCLAPLAGHAVERHQEGNRISEDVPPIGAELTAQMGQYLDARSAGFTGWLPDGGMLIATRFANTTQIHRVDHPLGARQQLTFYDEPISRAWPSPAAGGGYLLRRDIGGSEDFQIFHRSLASGKTRLVSDGSSRNGSPLWSHKGDRFAYQSNRRDGRNWDIYVTAIDSAPKAEMVFEGDGAWSPAAWSPDDRLLAISHYISINDNRLYVLNIETGLALRVNAEAPTISYGRVRPVFTNDGLGLYFGSDWGSQFVTLRHYDLAAGKSEELSADIPWDVTDIALSPDGRSLAFVTNEDGISRLYVIDTETGQRRRVEALPQGIILGLEFSPEGQQLALTLNRPVAPSDVYVLDLGGDKLTRWTRSETGGLDTAGFIEPRLIHYPTYDKVGGKPREIPAFLYQPVGDGPFPVMISIHGGPEGQARPYYSATTQFYVRQMGVAVIRPNVRGSAGYGKDYLRLDNGLKREDSVRDIGALLDWIDRQPGLDGGRVLLSGGSYGGYMVLGSMTHYNDRVRAAVERYGISDFATFLKNTRDYRRDLRRAEYGDERDPVIAAYFTKIAPINNAQRISKPMFVLQGANDPRVPASESEQMVAKIRANGGAVWYVLFTDEGHGFRKKVNSDYANLATAAFVKRYLLGQ